MLFIRYIFCMNNEVQTRKGEVKKPFDCHNGREKTLNRFFFKF